ncbi:hypothetical protein AVEN_248759-1 [Araneus ventricosus]|uniref:Uncharacterized protein n=1 Tax=Araneus ventricosus TaxID=182803 RepID=A0A4Y2PHN8_ARAVE|nr:hypothetical protein AVEN_248759-1 [Araneus ventricosus]
MPSTLSRLEVAPCGGRYSVNYVVTMRGIAVNEKKRAPPSSAFSYINATRRVSPFLAVNETERLPFFRLEPKFDTFRPFSSRDCIPNFIYRVCCGFQL